jgi:hypothetical protein
MSVYRLRSGVLAEDIGESVVVHVPTSSQALLLTGPAREAVLSLRDGRQPADVKVLAELENHGVVEVTDSRLVSRRSVLAGSAIAVGAGISVLAMPTAAFATSSQGAGSVQDLTSAGGYYLMWSVVAGDGSNFNVQGTLPGSLSVVPNLVLDSDFRGIQLTRNSSNWTPAAYDVSTDGTFFKDLFNAFLPDSGKELTATYTSDSTTYRVKINVQPTEFSSSLNITGGGSTLLEFTATLETDPFAPGFSNPSGLTIGNVTDLTLSGSLTGSATLDGSYDVVVAGGRKLKWTMAGASAASATGKWSVNGKSYTATYTGVG